MQIYKIFRYAPHFFSTPPPNPFCNPARPDPKPYTNVVISQKVRGVGKKFTRMEFNSIAHKGLTGNPAKTGQIFTDSHPYIAKAPKVTLDEQTAARYPSLQHLLNTDTTKFRLDFYRDNGGFLETNLARIEEGNINKQEKEKFSKELSMCVTLATNGFNVSYLESVERRYDILLNDTPAELKKVDSSKQIYRHARKAIINQGAKIVIFELPIIDAETWKQLNKIKEKGWECYYYTIENKTIHKL